VDLAKNVIQVNAVDSVGKVVTSKALQRDKFIAWCAQLPAGCLIAMEASSSAHHWARKLVALGLDARIIAAHLLEPYRLQGKSGKSDANDAAAICEAASPPTMRFVAIKTVAQQGMLSVHRLREGLKEERTACTNRIGGIVAEFGLVFAQSSKALRENLSTVMEDANNELASVARLVIERAQSQWAELDAHIEWCDERIAAHIKQDEHAKQATQLLGVGPVTASAVVATVGDFKQFKNGAQFGAWLPLTRISAQRVNACYELMDAAYCSTVIREEIQAARRVPLIDHNPRNGEKREFALHEAQRYKTRSGAERCNPRLNDEFGARHVQVRGHAKVMCHLMLGVVALCADQFTRLLV
jgi:transposase